jgi:ABC-2 type transport system permease protein
VTALFTAVLRDRRRAWIWWTIALVLTAIMIVGSFGAIEGQDALDESFEDIPESVRVLMGIDDELTLTSPAGYLNSQWFANMFPILLSIYGIGLGARLLAGEEGAGRLELLLAHPVARARLLSVRWWAALLLLAALFVVPTVVLLAMAPALDLSGIGMAALSAASASSLLLALLHTAVTYGVGAWTGSRGVALAAGSALTGGGFLLQSLANLSEALRPIRWLSPWHWFIDARPIVDGWSAMALPTVGTLVVSACVVVLGMARFQTRDIGSSRA